MRVFYKKTKKQKTTVLNMLDESLKLNVNFNLVKNGANINRVFKSNPIGLDAFLVQNIKVSNTIIQKKQLKTPIKNFI
jgi:hypothetical protein